MSATSAPPVKHPVLVWDAPVRIFHWLMVLCFAGAYLTSESEVWRLVHVTLGYTMVGLVGFRLLWGVMGTRYARFAEFVQGPGGVLRYLHTLLRGQPAHHTGHNPIGALSILAVLLLTLAIGVTGWAGYNEMAGEWVSDIHEGVANAMLAVIAVHVAGVVLSSRMHQENLARAMVTGRKSGTPQDAIRSAWWSLGAMMLVAVGCFWWLQWQSVAL
jgi:cytochrome b